MRKFFVGVLTAAAVLSACGDAEARGLFRRSRSGSSYHSVPAGCDNSTCRGVVEIMCKTLRMGHYGGNRGYEGVAMGYSGPEAALNNCCYSNSGMKVVDSAVAQAKNGAWYACKRYVR